MTAPTAIELPLTVAGVIRPGGGRFEVRDPGRTRDVVAGVTRATPKDADVAVAAAEHALREWAALTMDERCAALLRAADRLDVDALAPRLTQENGGSLRESQMDLSRAVALLRRTVDDARDYLPPDVIDTPEHFVRIEKRPVGVVGLVVPWNSPLVLSMAKVAPALVAGNTVVLKPSPLAPVVLTMVLEELAATLPGGTLTVLNGDGELGSAISRHPRIRKISFTGSLEVGRSVMEQAAMNIKKISLELGGNDPAILLDDVELATAARPLALGAFTRAGQICFAVKRVYAPRSRYAEVVDALTAELGDYRVGHGLEQGTTFGPLISDRQRHDVQGLVERTRRGGATTHELGAPLRDDTMSEGHYMLPTLVTDIDHSTELVGCEQFGPVLPIVPYDDIDDAIVMANDSEFGLASSVWSADDDRAFGVAQKIDAGVTFINSHNVWSLSFDLPFGGTKQSGLGRERTHLGLSEYVEHHAIRIIR